MFKLYFDAFNLIFPGIRICSTVFDYLVTLYWCLVIFCCARLYTVTLKYSRLLFIRMFCHVHVFCSVRLCVTMEQAGQSDQTWQDPSKVKAENINSVYQSYVQYPTGHLPRQQQAAPNNQPKLSNKNPVMHLNELRKGQRSNPSKTSCRNLISQKFSKSEVIYIY